MKNVLLGVVLTLIALAIVAWVVATLFQPRM